MLGRLGYRLDRSWAGEHDWHLLFPDARPHAGGLEHCAASSEDDAGYEVELVAG